MKITHLQKFTRMSFRWRLLSLLPIFMLYLCPVMLLARDGYSANDKTTHIGTHQPFCHADSITEGTQYISIADVKEKYDRHFMQEKLKDSNPFMKNLKAWLGKRMSISEFETVIQKRVDAMSDKEKKLVEEIRLKMPAEIITSSTLMQKIIPESAAANYINGAFSPVVSNSVSRACDELHLTTVADYCYGLRLDYDGSPFFDGDKIAVEKIYILRFTLESTEGLRIPIGENDLQIKPYPFTGNGFTSGNHGVMGVPEFVTDHFAHMSTCQIWCIDKDGNETLVAVLEYDKTANKNIFKKVLNN